MKTLFKLVASVSLLGAVSTSIAFQGPAEPEKAPSEYCRGLAPEEFARCKAQVARHLQDLKEVRTNHLAKKNSFKALPVLLEYADGTTQNAKLAYEGVTGRVVHAGARIKVDCMWGALPATKGQPFTEGHCFLTYPKIELDWMDTNYLVHFGEQPVLGIGMDGAGFLDVDFVEMLDPVPAKYIKPTLATPNVRLIK